MDEIDDGGPAFPCVCPKDFQFANDGMTLRDWFAGQALMGDITTLRGETLDKRKDETVEQALERDAKRRAAWCYRQADAMLAARKEGK